MSLDGTYDADNIFAKILRGEMPAVKVYEDDTALAFMDVFPQAEGHTLVIPKRAAAQYSGNRCRQPDQGHHRCADADESAGG